MIHESVAQASGHLWLNHHDDLGFAAGLLSVSSYLPYVRSTLHGTTRPNRASWWVWAVLGAISFAAYLQSGLRTSGVAPLLVPGLAAVGPFFVALLSLRYGTGGVDRLDYVALGGSALGLVAWGMTGSPSVGLAFLIAVNTVATLPTISKAFHSPATENLFAWSLATSGTALNLLALGHWGLPQVAYPLYLVTVNVLIVAALLVGRRRGELVARI